MLTFKFLRAAGKYVVVGPPDEMRLGLVRVQRTNGEVKSETIVKLGAVFDTPDGPRQYGFIASLPRSDRPTRLKPTERPQRFPVTVRKLDDQGG